MHDGGAASQSGTNTFRRPLTYQQDVSAGHDVGEFATPQVLGCGWLQP